MMEASASVTLMVMYEDESVEIRYGNGAELQLSPCGCEFVLVRAADPRGHPLQPTERLRQRTRFTVSAYKEFLVDALAFRNKYSTRPYLVDELIPADQKKPFFSVDSDVHWPQVSLCESELGDKGETIIRSEDGRAELKLSPSGEDFIVEFKCALSQARNQLHHDGSPNTQHQAVDNTTSPGGGSGISDDSKDSYRAQGSSSSKRSATILSTKPEAVFQSTTVVQHHSCCAVSPTWSYPLSLAQHQRTARIDTSPEYFQAHGSRTQTQEDGRVLEKVPEERRSHLPQALPLSCPTPHWHRWKLKDPLAKKDHSDEDLPTELVKVMWCQGATYRILSGAVSVIEVSPGDSSLIRSNGVLDSYFTHYKPELQSGEVQEVTYHLSSLPPDVPGQPYSIDSIVNRASRVLTCYDQTKQSLKLPVSPSCLAEASHFTEAKISEEILSSVPSVKQQIEVVQSRSDLVADELEKIKRFNFLLENSHLLRGDGRSRELDTVSAEDLTPEPVNENCITEALHRTSKAIQDIDAVISAATLTYSEP